MLPQTNPAPDQAHAENEATEPRTGRDKTDGDPVVLATGNFLLEQLDMSLAGRGGLDVEIKRTYRNGTSVETALGPKWDLNWFKRIVVHFSSCNGVPLRMYYYDGATRMRCSASAVGALAFQGTCAR